MKKVWLVANITYREHLRSGSFLILTFALPLLMLLAGAVPVILMLNEAAPRLAYVNHSPSLRPVAQVEVDGEAIALTAFDDPAAAMDALAQQAIDGFLIIPADYAGGGRPRFLAAETPGPATQEILTEFMRRSLLAGQPDWVAARLADPTHLTYIERDSGQAIAEGPDLLAHIFLPLALAMMFALLVFTGTGQMGAALVQEKEQRSLEMVLTSLAPWQLVGGKALGITLLTLTQLAIWLAGAAIAAGLALVAYAEPVPALPWATLLWAALLGIPAYLLYAALGAGLGLIAGDRQQARQLAGLLGFIGLSPLYLMGLLINAPDGPLAIGLTLFPLTAPVIALFRLALTPVPLWQLVASLLILLTCLLLGVWAVARLFRGALLLSGQPLRPKQLWQALRQA
ncbi:MAG: hypothetical protein Kow0031_30890 [Anaerolineae bacterium]